MPAVPDGVLLHAATDLVDDGRRDGVSTEAAAEIRELRKRNRELEETIEVLKAATSFFVRESDPRSRR